MTQKLFKILAGLICIIALAFGIVRIGVGSVLMAQAAGIIDIAAFSEPITDIQRFTLEKNDQAIIPLNPISYLAIIAFMGICLVFGAIGAWRQKFAGYAFLVAYLLIHAGLFFNFQTINPKINILIGGIGLLIVLIFANTQRHE